MKPYSIIMDTGVCGRASLSNGELIAFCACLHLVFFINLQVCALQLKTSSRAVFVCCQTILHSPSIRSTIQSTWQLLLDWEGRCYATNTSKWLKVDGRALLSAHKAHTGALPAEQSLLPLLLTLCCWSCCKAVPSRVPQLPPDTPWSTTGGTSITGWRTLFNCMRFYFH